MMRVFGLVFVSGMFLIFTGCSSMYYGALEKIGIEKRDLLEGRVKKARDSQVEAKEQFQSALEAFRQVREFDGGKLEKVYSRLSAELDESEEKAELVKERIQSVEDVAEALFEEWKDELGEYENQSLKRKSRQQLEKTRQKYQDLIQAMHNVENRIEPALTPLRDQVLFLKHNLNARAIASLQTELDEIQSDVDALIAGMNHSIQKAEDFLSEMKK